MVLEYLEKLYVLGLYTLAEIRAMVTGIPLEDNWVSLPDGRYVDVNAAARRGDVIEYDEVGNILSVLPGGYVATGDIEAGDLVTLDADGFARKAMPGDAPIGIAEGNGMVRFGDVHVAAEPGSHDQVRAAQAALDASILGGYEPTHVLAGRGGSLSYHMHASMAYRHGSQGYVTDGRVARLHATRAAYQAQSAEQKEAEEKSWKLLDKYMTPEQHFAFMEGTTVELINKAETHRILINKKGDFNILQGIKAGAGVSESEGRIHRYEYPLGDQISAFLDWFRHRTGELIANWNCGTYGIVKKGERR